MAMGLEDGSLVAGALLVSPLFSALCFFLAAQVTHGRCTVEVTIIAPVATVVAIVLRMFLLPPFPVAASIHIIALLTALSAMRALPARARMFVAVWLFIVPFSIWVHALDHEPFSPEPELQVHWHGETFAGGFLSIVSAGSPNLKYLVMKMDHSLLGGIYLQPSDVEGECIYSVFHVQEAVLLTRPPDAPPGRALVIGLGPGTAAMGLQAAGVTVDVMELHKEVVHTAEAYFGWEPNGRVWAMDAVATVALLERTEPDIRYDFILHDVCSGGAMAETLLSLHFLRKLSRLLADNGVIAINFFGGEDSNLHLLGRTIEMAFGHVRCFGDEHTDSPTRNFVFFASRSPVSFRPPSPEDFRGSSMQAEALATFHSREILLKLGSDLGVLDDPSQGFDTDALMMYARSHWEAMRSILPSSFWTSAF